LDLLAHWYFHETTPWNKVYQFIEFVGNLTNDLRDEADAFRRACNLVLERECSAYRFVGTTIAPITSEAEIKTIEEAASMNTNPLRLVSTHIDTALKHLSDKKEPDYRNSMKESISAVEALCKFIARNEKATLGHALTAVTARVKLHPKLQAALKSLYDYTSDDYGIRHALKDDAEPEAEDARFLLVTYSAVVNYLVEKVSKNGLMTN
jgi:hypothetical protein